VEGGSRSGVHVGVGVREMTEHRGGVEGRRHRVRVDGRGLRERVPLEARHARRHQGQHPSRSLGRAHTRSCRSAKHGIRWREGNALRMIRSRIVLLMLLSRASGRIRCRYGCRIGRGRGRDTDGGSTADGCERGGIGRYGLRGVMAMLKRRVRGLERSVERRVGRSVEGRWRRMER
jgi:hypothetical protein